MISFVVRLVRQRRSRTLPLLIALGTYTIGAIAFSLVDFQARIDLFLVLHLLALFAALPLVDGYYALVHAIDRRGGAAARPIRGIVAVATVVLLVLLIRPSTLRSGKRIDTAVRDQARATLGDQRSVAGLFAEMVGDESVAIVRYQELLYLSGLTNGMPFVSWNLGTYSHYAEEGEQFLDTLARLLEPAGPAVIVIADGWLTYLHRMRLGQWMYSAYQPLLLSSENDRYQVVVWYRKDLPPPAVRGVYYLDSRALIARGEEMAGAAE
jgi:hypothetical protein